MQVLNYVAKQLYVVTAAESRIGGKA